LKSEVSKQINTTKSIIFDKLIEKGVEVDEKNVEVNSEELY